MLFHTHILLGITFFLLLEDLFSGGNEIIFFLLVLLGSILPDLDSARSRINRWSGIIGIIIAFFFRHRGIMHSLFLHLLLFFTITLTFDVYYASGLFLGYLAHVVGDGATRGGLMVFYPFSKYKIKGPIRVGSFSENLILVLLVGIIIWKYFV